MSVTRFKSLLAIAKLGTFAKAADAMHRTPAAISQQMRSLELEMGATLFDRSKRPPELNPAGYALVPKAQELVSAYEALSGSLKNTISTVEELIIGPVPSTMTGLIPRALKILQHSDSQLRIRVYPSLSSELYAQIDRGFLDAAIITEPVSIHDHLRWQPFSEEPLVVVASVETKYDDPIKLLQAYPFIRFARRAWVGRTIDDWLLANKVQVKESVETDTLEAVTIWAYQNLGVSIIPASCCQPNPHFELKLIPLPRSSPRILGVLSRLDSSKSKYIDKLFNSLESVVNSAKIEGMSSKTI